VRHDGRRFQCARQFVALAVKRGAQRLSVSQHSLWRKHVLQRKPRFVCLALQRVQISDPLRNMTGLSKQILQLMFVVGLAHLVSRAAGLESGRADGSDVV
jgi:hypothetical protein